MASNSRTLELTADVRGFHVFQKKWKPALNEQLHCLQEPGNDVFSIKIWKPDTQLWAIFQERYQGLPNFCLAMVPK